MKKNYNSLVLPVLDIFIDDLEAIFLTAKQAGFTKVKICTNKNEYTSINDLMDNNKDRPSHDLEINLSNNNNQILFINID